MAGEADLKAQIVIEAQDQASAVLRNLAGSLGQLGGAFTQMAGLAGPVGLALGAIATGLGAVVSTGRAVADQVEQLDLLSARTGVSVEALQVLHRQIGELGGNTESLTQAMTFLNRSIATNDPLLGQLGITSKDTLTAFQQLSEAFANSNDTAKKTEIAYRLLGRGSAELLGILPQLASGFDATKASMEAAGGIMTGSVLKAARELDAQADQLESNWANLMTNLKATTLPAAIAVTNALNDMWDAVAGRTKSPLQQIERNISDVTGKLRYAEQQLNDMDFSGFVSDSKLRDQEAKIAALKSQLQDLEGTRNRTARALSGTLGPTREDRGPDRIASTVLDPPKKTEKSEREKEIERITKALGDTLGPADQVYDRLQRISEARFADSIREALTAGPEISSELAASNSEIDSMAKLFHISRDEAAGVVEQLHALDEERKRQQITNQLQGEQRVSVDDIVAKWADSVVEMQDLANVVDETFGSLFSGLEQGFNTVFQNMLTQGQTFASAMETLFRSMVSALLSELARLAAVAVFKQILGFFTGGAGSIAIPNLAPGVPGTFGAVNPAGNFAIQAPPQGAVTTTVAPTQEDKAKAEQPPVGNTFNVYTYDAHAIVADLVSPSGKLRRAQDTVAVLGAY